MWLTQSAGKSCERVTIGFGFTSDWMKRWRESFKPIASCRKCKTNYFSTLKWKPLYTCTFVLIRIGLIGWTQTFFYWKRESTRIKNRKSKLQQRHTSLTCTFLSFFFLLFDNSPFLLCLPSIFGWLLLGAFSTGLACITIFISYFNSFLFASLTFGASSTITLLWSTSWASLTSPITVIIDNFRLSVPLGKTETN